MAENNIYSLNKTTISTLDLKQKIGTYALLSFYENAKYVGRSTNLDDELRAWANKRNNYRKFIYWIWENERIAYVSECQLYHKYYGYLDNEIHPVKPESWDRSCPHEGCNE